MAIGTFDSSLLEFDDSSKPGGWFDRMLVDLPSSPGPVVSTSTPLASPLWHPGRHPGRFRPTQQRRAYLPGATVAPTIPARGPATAATLIIDAEAGAQVTYSWATDVQRSRSGKEHRLQLLGAPRETYEFQAQLDDGQIAVIQSALVANAAQGDAFAVGLSHESVLVTAASSGTTIATSTTDYSDWMYAGQTVAVVSRDGRTVATGVLQSFTTNSITLDVAVTAQAFGRVMPTIPCYLDDTQGLNLYAVNAGIYKLKARAVYSGNASGAWASRGAPALTTYTDPISSAVYPVYDRGLLTQETSPRAAMTGADLTDRGAILLLTPAQAVVDFSRELMSATSNDSERQLWKRFHGAVAGRARVFLVPTWKPDLLPVTDATTGVIKVFGPPTPGTADFVNQWRQSPAHTHLQLLRSDGTLGYRTVTDAADNFDGTQSIQLDSAFTGDVARVSFLEQARFDSDDIVVTFNDAAAGGCKVPVRVVQQ